jgi:hypothetical protein
MSQTPAVAPPAPMSPNAVMTAFHYVQSLQEGDIETAGMLANAEPRLLTLLIDVADRIVTPITALPSAGEGDPCRDSFALEALGRIFLTRLRAEDDLCPASVPGIARAIIRFVEEILTEDGQDVADVLEQLETAALRQAHEAHRAPGAQSARTTDM